MVEPAASVTGSIEDNAAAGERDDEDLEQVWQQVLEAIRTRGPLAWLTRMKLTQLDRSSATIAPTPGQREVVTLAMMRTEQVGALLQQVLGRPVKVVVDPGEEDAAPAPPPPETERGQLIREAMQLPLVQQLNEQLGARLLDARRSATAGGNRGDHDSAVTDPTMDDEDHDV